MVATSIAINKGYKTNSSLEPKRIKLLKDKDYRKYISEGTMSVDHIQGRIKKALKIIYGMDY